MLIEKYRDHQQAVYHCFIDFRKAFDRVWHKALFKIMRAHGIEARIVDLIEALYATTEAAIVVGSTITDWFTTSVGVRQGCLLSPCLFNVFLEYIMSDALEEFDGSVCIGGMCVTNLRFADDIDLIASSVEELMDLTEHVDTSATRLGMQINASKTKSMAAPEGGGDLGCIQVGNERIEEVSQFKYLGAVITSDGKSDVEIRRRLALGKQKIIELQFIWKSPSLSLPTKFRFVRSIVLATVLYGCQSWTLSASSMRRISSFEMKCFRRLLGVTYHDRRTNQSILEEINDIIGARMRLANEVKKFKLMWFGHVTRHDVFSKPFLQGSTPGSRPRGRPATSWISNIKSWTGLPLHALSHAAHDRVGFRDIIHNSLAD